MNCLQSSLTGLLSLCVCLVSFSQLAAAAPHDELQFLPKDTTFIIQVDVTALQKTKLFQDVALTNPAFQQGIEKMKNELGVDPLTSIKLMTMGFGTIGDGKDMSIVIDMPLKVDAKPLNKPGTKKLTHKGQPYFDLGKDGAALVSGGHSVLGQKARILKTIEQIQSKGAMKGPLAVQSKARDPKAQVWFFGRPPAGQVGQMANQVKEIMGHVDLSVGLKASVSVKADPNWVKIVSGSIEMQKMNAGQNPMMAATGLGAMFQKLKLQDKGEMLTMSIALTPQEVDKLKGIAAMFAAQQAQSTAGQGAPIPPAAMPKPGATPPGMSPLPKPPVGQPLIPQQPSPPSKALPTK